MPTETKPPPPEVAPATGRARVPLNLDELHQLKWLLGGVLTLLAVWTVSYMDIDAWELVVLTTLGSVSCVLRPTVPSRLPALAHTLAFPVIVAFFVADLWLTSQILPAMVRLDILLLLYRNVSYRQRRDDLQVIVLGLFLIVVAGVITVSLAFAAQILIYTACALLFLLTITLTDAAQGRNRKAEPKDNKHAPPSWAVHADWPRLFRRLREVTDWRVVTLAGGLFAGVVAVSALLFLAIPRFQLENSLFLDRFISKKTRSGFNDSIRFGDVSEIQQDTSVALSVDISDRAEAPAAPYWRMVVLDDYVDGTFKLSARLRSAAFSREQTRATVLRKPRPVLGSAVYWTFYLEAGVSRYLPLPGPWEKLQFRESQNFQVAEDLGLVRLREEPATMTAYRVEGLETSAVFPDPAFAKLWRERTPYTLARSTLQTRLGLADQDQARLTQIVAEITGGGKLGASEFADRAGAWLRQHHSYSLSPVIPRGNGDPLVRWLASREVGHCELFAGSVVLLARVAGFPAHIVTGFRGGTWNAYSNNFTVRNSDAHAWAEVFDADLGAWRRADAIAAPEAQQAGEQKGEAALARRTDSSWKARWDSLRIFWYRRIVSFDRQSQEETLKSIKSGVQRSGQRLREALENAAAAVREWLGGPWDVRRIANVIGGIAAALVLVWAWREWGRRWWRRLVHRASGHSADPVRADASRWLGKLAECPAPDSACVEVRAELQRLRFGSSATWPEPEKVFRRARRALRAARRARGRVSLT